MSIVTRRTRIPLWQSIIISVVTAAAAVSIYEVAFVHDAAPPLAPVIIALPTPEAVACPPPVALRVTEAPERTERTDQGSERARLMFTEAVDMMRNREIEQGCEVLNRVAGMRDGGIFADKAQSLFGRRCD
jgi:hypothetical protein